MELVLLRVLLLEVHARDFQHLHGSICEPSANIILLMNVAHRHERGDEADALDDLEVYQRFYVETRFAAEDHEQVVLRQLRLLHAAPPPRSCFRS